MLRFWQLSRFNALVFDEIYFVKFAQAYLARYPEFDAHPPLGKYLIAAGIWLNAHRPFSHQTLPLTSAQGLLPFSYRWMNAFVGSLLPLIAIGIAHTLCQPPHSAKSSPLKVRTFSLLAGLFVAIDGLFITESRYALLNIYAVFFGLLGHWLWLQAKVFAAVRKKRQRTISFILAGMALGAAVAVKWNALGYWLSLGLLEIVWQKRHPIDLITRVRRGLICNLICGLIYGIIIPFATYGLIWQPHLRLTGWRLGSLHSALFTFHQQMSAGGHPACARWYTWPLMIRPFAYWYQENGGQVYTVNNIGNPMLWWLSSAAIALIFLESIRQLKNSLTQASAPASNANAFYTIGPYLLVSYGANWLPWLLVSRCTFIYLYMPAAAFSFMALAWLLSEWLHSPTGWIRNLAVVMLGAIATAFAFWLPLNLGSPLTPNSLQLRWWLKSWI